MTTYAATNVPLRIIYGLKDAGLIDIIPSNGKVVVGQGQFLSKALS
jgi:ribosomal protein S19E (S16A)